jgi:hypothetical protein
VNFLPSCAGAAADDSSGVAHPSPGWCGNARDEGNDGLGHLSLDEIGGLLLQSATDFPDEDHCCCLFVMLKELEDVHEGAPRQWVATNANASGLP